MELTSFLTSSFGLIFIISLIWVISIALKKYGIHRLPITTKAKNKRISISDALVLDARRKLILVRCDDKEHLILIGADKDVVIESRNAKSEVG